MNFYFYDLETSGVNPREQRIMQFAGQMTNDMLEPIGEIDNILITLSPDVLPEPWAILTHKITPQQTISEGISEAEFLKWFHSKVVQPDVVFAGYNSIRFDDEFMRYLHYRNFYDPYEWQWQDGRGKWDLLDVARMTRALRPDGIEWPFSTDGRPNLKLDNLTKVNGIEHEGAHTADSDVNATIEFAKLLRDKQPKLFNYLLGMRSKKDVSKLVTSGQPFVYTSGKYPSEYEKTTVAVSLGGHPELPGSLLVYDLRVDPNTLGGLSADQLAERIFVPRGSDLERLPVKTLALNKCPAVAPLGVLDEKAQKNIKIDMGNVAKNMESLKSLGLAPIIKDAFSMKHKNRQSSFLTDDQLVDAQLYDGFFGATDKSLSAKVRLVGADGLADLTPNFTDSRLDKLLPLYKARNFSKSLNETEQKEWTQYVHTKLFAGKPSRLEAFSENLAKAVTQISGKAAEEYLLSELQLYVQSLIPEEQ